VSARLDARRFVLVRWVILNSAMRTLARNRH